jgi:hypothetical protein
MPRILEFRIVRLISLIFFSLLGFSLISPGALAEEKAEEKFERAGFWGGVNFGVGFVQRSFAGIEEDENNFFLGFEGGYTLNPHFLIGVELSGWLLEASNLGDPSKGEGISQVFLITRYYPSSTMGLFAKIGGGYVSHWNNEPGEPSRKGGWGLTFGGGYDFPLNKNFAITPFINYGFGEADDQDHNVWTLGIGLTIQ